LSAVVRGIVLVVAFLVAQTGLSAAAQAEVVADCTTAMAGRTFTLVVGTTTTLEYTSCGNGTGAPYLDNSLSSSGSWLTTQPFGTGSSAGSFAGTGAWWTRLTAGAGDANLSQTLYLNYNNGASVVGYTVNIVSVPVPAVPASTVAPVAPAPVLQQFGLMSEVSCEESAPAELDLSGVSSGGWPSSWAQWVGGGAGGFVCTRTLSYQSGTDMWLTSGSVLMGSGQLQQYAIGSAAVVRMVADESMTASQARVAYCRTHAPESPELGSDWGQRNEGWSPSYASWLNDGAGGWVCSRSV